MKRTHALLISLVLAVAVLFGSFAAIRSTQLSTASATPQPDAAQIALQNAALVRAESTLRAELRRKQPASFLAVVYRRAPTIVHVVHRHGHDDGGGGFDD